MLLGAESSRSRISVSSSSRKQGSSEAHPLGDQPERLSIRLGLAHRVDGALVEREPVVAPREHDILVLQLGRGRQHDIGVRGGVGHELLQHDGEQVVTAHPLEDPALLRRYRGGIRVPAHERLDRRVELGVGECAADLRHVDGPHGARPQVLAHERVGGQRGRGGGGHVRATAALVAPGAGERGQAGDGAVGHRRALVALRAHAEPQQRRVGRGELAAQARDGLRRRPRTPPRSAPRGAPPVAPAARRTRSCVRGTTPRRPSRRPRPPASCPAPARRRCRAAAARARPPPAPCGCGMGPPPPSGPRCAWPPAAASRGAARWTSGSIPTAACSARPASARDRPPGEMPWVAMTPAMPGGRADRAHELGGAERVHHPRAHQVVLEQPHRALVAVRQDRLAAVLVDRRAQPLRHAVQRLVPGRAPELPRALRPDRDQRMQQPVLGVDAVEVVADTLPQRNPAVTGWSGLPATSVARPPSSTDTSIAHVSGQSCGQAARTVRATLLVYRPRGRRSSHLSRSRSS